MARDQNLHELYDTVDVAWICILGCEFHAVRSLLDEQYHDLNSGPQRYVLGRMGDHNVVIAFFPAGTMGAAETMKIALGIQRDFRNVRFCLLVGVGGGCPDPDERARDIRLGDVVVSQPKMNRGGVVQTDMGKNTDGGFKIGSHLNKADSVLLNAIQLLNSDHRQRGRTMDRYISAVMDKSDPRELQRIKRPAPETDRLFQSDYPHPPGAADCKACDNHRTRERQTREERPEIFYGTIGSANSVLRSARERDDLIRKEGVLCVEMEASGLMDVLPSLVVRGICDYADSHKNKEWQEYAALAAAAYAKDLLTYVRKADPVIVHGAHCSLGIVRLDEVQRAWAAKPIAFREDLRELGAAMANVKLHFFDDRLPRFQKFLQDHNLPRVTHWVTSTKKDQIFDGYTEASAKAARDDHNRDPRQRLAAARAFAFISSNMHCLTTTYLMQDTVLRMWDYVESGQVRVGMAVVQE